jgi:nitrite reductase/ring-hydroxylating ferredoxin subunit
MQMYLRLCSTNDIPVGCIKRFYLRDQEFLVVNLNGQFYCLDGRCSHAGAPLAEGDLEGEFLTCPWHYSQFKITDGSVVNGPANKPLNVYRYVIKDNQLLLELKTKTTFHTL